MESIDKSKELFSTYSMHLFGIVAFISTFSLGTIALINHSHDLIKYLPYGVLIFIINLIYLKIIILSRQDYENLLKQEKEYSQELLKYQKLFLRHAIHETNTPLAVIIANIELYELELGKHPILSNIEAATKNIYGIYDDLGYLIKKDQISYPKRDIILTEFIQTRIEFFNIVARQSYLSLELHEACSLSFIHINETKLQRIIDNNITNAIKYTRELETIHILVFEEAEHCIFEISSSSSIIKDKERIFEAYYREDVKEEGLGLGLNLVKNICDNENIRIELHSKEDSTFFRYYFKKVYNEDIAFRG